MAGRGGGIHEEGTASAAGLLLVHFHPGFPPLLRPPPSLEAGFRDTPPPPFPVNSTHHPESWLAVYFCSASLANGPHLEAWVSCFFISLVHRDTP